MNYNSKNKVGFRIFKQKMETRNSLILQIRGESIGTISESTSIQERFQNQVLRPILKFQNDLLIVIFLNYAEKQKNVFFQFSNLKKMDYIENSIQKDMKFRSYLLGNITSLFTLEEYKIYEQETSNINRRITTMIIERLKSQLQILEKTK